MMRQFEVVVANGGIRYLTRVDTSRWDYFWGFLRIVKVLAQPQPDRQTSTIDNTTTGATNA